jgi:hypothetical protein
MNRTGKSISYPMDSEDSDGPERYNKQRYSEGGRMINYFEEYDLSVFTNRKKTLCTAAEAAGKMADVLE